MPERPGFEIPPRVTPAGDNSYLEQMAKAIFQAGFSWQVVRQRRSPGLGRPLSFDSSWVWPFSSPAR
jgi:hypothetical protein